jgi:hypothetical protein
MAVSIRSWRFRHVARNIKVTSARRWRVTLVFETCLTSQRCVLDHFLAWDPQLTKLVMDAAIINDSFPIMCHKKVSVLYDTYHSTLCTSIDWSMTYNIPPASIFVVKGGSDGSKTFACNFEMCCPKNF